MLAVLLSLVRVPLQDGLQLLFFFDNSEAWDRVHGFVLLNELSIRWISDH
jgi:hypothetical protein